MGFSELSYCANITFLRHFYIVGSAFSSTFFEWLYRVSTCGIDREIEWFVVFSAFWVFWARRASNSRVQIIMELAVVGPTIE